MPNTIRLLFIEDDPDVAELLFTYFNMVNYEVYHAADGRDGIALAREKHPNLILLDVMLPDMSGWDIARSLRTAALTRYVPIIFLTQRSERPDKISGLSLGADDYVTKPFDVEELRLRVQAAIRRATQDRLYEPRTGLPGGPLIEAELSRRDGESGWMQLVAWIEGLKAFRDVYGFMAADEVLGFAAKQVLGAIRQHGTPNDFVGVTEEDTLILLTHTTTPNSLCKAAQDRFNASARSFYNFTDAEQGYVVLNPDTDQEEHVPLMVLHVEPGE